MGIAAVQAKFGLITSRKADCEFRSMRIAQDKLSITRDMAKASDEYQSALNQTKLIWNYDGEGKAAFNLSYDLMMTPSVLNNYDPYLITSRTGQVVLNGKMAAAARAAGLSQDGGKTSLTKENRDAFLEALGAQGHLSASMINTITSDSTSYSSKAGLGGAALDKTAANVVSINTLLNYTDSITKTGSSGFANADITALAKLLTFDTGYNASTTKQYAANQTYININNSLSTDESYTFADLLSENVTLVATNGNDTNIKSDATAFINQLYEAFSKLFVSDNQSNATQALGFALAETLKLLNSSESPSGDLVKNSNKYNCIVSGKVGKIGAEAISLSNLTRAFMTSYAQAIGGYQTGYSIKNKASDSIYVTDDSNYYYVINNLESSGNEKDLLVADFYNMMFNNICMNGWTTVGGDVNDSEYLSHALKNGQLFISSLNNDGYFYQDAYTRNGYVAEVTDDEAIARAEAEFTSKKAKLNYKEEMLELQMKNIDTELSSLTTEYDTVKNMLSKNVEKTFSLFQQ